ncbi:Ba01 [Baboon cytomegalovirus]|nr:Ba01 [Baboon cytomegalovirus]
MASERPSRHDHTRRLHRPRKPRHEVPWHRTLTRWQTCTIRVPGLGCAVCGDNRYAGDTYLGTCEENMDHTNNPLTDYSGDSDSDEEAVNKYRRRLWNLPDSTDSTDSSDSGSQSFSDSASDQAFTREEPGTSSEEHLRSPSHLQYLPEAAGAARTQSSRDAEAARTGLPPRDGAASDARHTPASAARTCRRPHLRRRKRVKLAHARASRDPVGDQADDALRVRGYPVTRRHMNTGYTERMSPDRGARDQPDCWCLWGEYAEKAQRPIVPLLVSRTRDGPTKSGAWDVLRGRGYGYRAIPGPDGESRPVWTQHVVFLLGGHGPRVHLNRPSAREAEARGLLPRWPMRPQTHTGAQYTRYTIHTTELQHVPRVLLKHEILRAVPQTGTSRLAERGERGAWIVTDTFTAPGRKLTANTRPAEEWWKRDSSVERLEETLAHLRETASAPGAPRLTRRRIIHTDTSSSYYSSADSLPSSDTESADESEGEESSEEERDRYQIESYQQESYEQDAEALASGSPDDDNNNSSSSDDEENNT